MDGNVSNHLSLIPHMCVNHLHAYNALTITTKSSHNLTYTYSGQTSTHLALDNGLIFNSDLSVGSEGDSNRLGLLPRVESGVCRRDGEHLAVVNPIPGNIKKEAVEE